MPNWCSTDIEIIGKREEMNKLAAIINENKEPGFLETICPSPNGDWDYAWSVENWGTKWDLGDGHAVVEDLATAHPHLQARLTILQRLHGLLPSKHSAPIWRTIQRTLSSVVTMNPAWTSRAYGKKVTMTASKTCMMRTSTGQSQAV
jgi:hypothetical protein